jgi:hypothetical protein
LLDFVLCKAIVEVHPKNVNGTLIGKFAKTVLGEWGSDHEKVRVHFVRVGTKRAKSASEPVAGIRQHCGFGEVDAGLIVEPAAIDKVSCSTVNRLAFFLIPVGCE